MIFQPQKTPGPPESGVEAYVVAVVFAFLLVLAIGTNPFMEGSGIAIDMSGAGDKTRQILLLSLFAAAVPIFITRREQLFRILLTNRSFLLLVGWSLLSILWSNAMDIAAHRMAGTLLVAALTLLSASLPPRRLVTLLLTLTGTIMTVNYLGVILVPHLALDHEGMWTGLHMHKNIAGYFSAVSALLWLFIGLARKSKWLFLSGMVWVVFLWSTGSRTSLAIFLFLLPLGLFFNAGLMRYFDRRLLLLLVLSFGLVFPLFTYVVFTLLTDAFHLDASFIDVTFTGRTEIWQFVWREVLQSPLLGSGYGSFWAIGDQSPALLRANEFVEQYTESHNGYLDVLVSLGVIGLALVLSALLQPYRALLHYRNSHNDTETREVLLFALLLLTFGILHNVLESTLLHGLSVVWTLMLLSLWIITSKIHSSVDGFHSRRPP